jgi:hypothetical protein
VLGFFDIRSLSLVVGLNSVAMAGIMAYISMTRLTYPGFHHWTISFAFGGLGMILISLRNIAPDWVSILLANSCIIAFPALLAIGLAKFLDKPLRSWLPLSVLPIALVLFTYFTYWQPSVNARVVVIALATSLLLAFSFFLMLLNARSQLGFSNNLLNTVLVALSIWGLARAYFTHQSERHISDFLSAGTLQGFSFVIYTLGCLFILGGLVTLNAQRMESELASADQKVKNMSRLIPICASCKKIRDDEGYWGEVELYIQKVTDTDLTHGICPECMKKLYPEYSKN